MRMVQGGLDTRVPVPTPIPFKFTSNYPNLTYQSRYLYLFLVDIFYRCQSNLGPIATISIWLVPTQHEYYTHLSK